MLASACLKSSEWDLSRLSLLFVSLALELEEEVLKEGKGVTEGDGEKVGTTHQSLPNRSAHLNRISYRDTIHTPSSSQNTLFPFSQFNCHRAECLHPKLTTAS